MKDIGKIKPKKIYTLTDKQMKQAIADYIVKNSDENSIFGDEMNITYYNGTVVEKPLFTKLRVEVE